MPGEADILFARLIAGDCTDEVVYRLYQEFASGYDIGQMKALLASSDSSVVDAASWICQELGARFTPLISHAVELLRHESAATRYNVIECVLVCANQDCGEALGAALGCMSDVARIVRIQAMQFVARASVQQLMAAIRWRSAIDSRDIHAEKAGWLINAKDDGPIRKQLGAEDSLDRRYAVACAARRKLLGTSDLLDDVVGAADPEIAKFAKRVLAWQTGS